MSLARSRGTCRPLRWAASPSPYTRLNASPSIIILTQRRLIHSSEKRTNTLAEHPIPDPMPPNMGSPVRAPLSVLSLAMIIRSLATTIVSSSPVLLPPSLRIMDVLANSHSPLLNPDRNPLLRLFLKKTFYAQFCAGENAAEVHQTITNLKGMGFTGVLLCYAREVVLTKEQAAALGSTAQETEAAIKNEILPWAEGTLETVRLVQPGDYVALKFTGAGSIALGQLKARQPATPTLHKAIDDICKLAQERGVRLLFDAEQDMLQDGIDDWTLEFARKYNKDTTDPVIYGTYQAYKKACPEVLSSHLALAQKEGFALGVKLVRGAYLGSDPRHLFHDTKEDTDKCYDTLAASVLTRQWSDAVKGEGKYPAASLMIASHNAESVQRARDICDAGDAKSPVSFAQLQGMADEVSCELVEAGQAAREERGAKAPTLPAYKYLVWGTTGECMKYLLRRAQENKDAVQRTRDSRDAMWGELVRRCKSAVGLA